MCISGDRYWLTEPLGLIVLSPESSRDVSIHTFAVVLSLIKPWRATRRPRSERFSRRVWPWVFEFSFQHHPDPVLSERKTIKFQFVAKNKVIYNITYCKIARRRFSRRWPDE